MNDLLQILSDFEYHSGEAISRELGVTRAAIWKRVEYLRTQGIMIESAVRRGYRLPKPYDPLYPPLLTIPGCQIEYKPQMMSTNAKACELARAGAAQGILVIAESQTGGRGRRGRPWSSAKGGLWFSLILKPNMSPAIAPRIPLVAAVAAAQAIESITGLCARVKWPNDILIDGKKACGILLEMSIEAERVVWLVMGVGINVAQEKSDFPDELQSIVTSLTIESGSPVKRGDVLTSFMGRFMSWYRGLENGAESYFKDEFLPEYVKRSATLGRDVTITSDDGTYEAKALSLGEHGELIVSTRDESTRAVYAADVSVRTSTIT